MRKSTTEELVTKLAVLQAQEARINASALYELFYIDEYNGDGEPQVRRLCVEFIKNRHLIDSTLFGLGITEYEPRPAWVEMADKLWGEK